MKKITILCVLALMAVAGAYAQRMTDKLDRGLVAVRTSSGVFVSWRIFAEEYYGTTYNIYRNGEKLNEQPLEVSNYKDASGNANSQYTVSAVVRGVEQPQCAAVKAWTKSDGSNYYWNIAMKPVYGRGGRDVTKLLNYKINDVSLGDLTGDGRSEFIVKRVNQKDADDLFPVTNDSAFNWFEAYDMEGNRLWYIDLGPNMVSGSNVEQNCVAYDWDMDGKAEVLLRGADGTIIHYRKADGTWAERVVGDIKVNTRNTISHTANMTYTNTGAEYLIYMRGDTGEPYVVMNYPLERGDANDWGDGYGHRSSKYFFGAPYLDGRHPSIFLARGIYTRHKFAAYDVDPQTHRLKYRWTWTSDGLPGVWYGQGNHNYAIADVDLDGRDEIVYGSMVIDDNGYGLSTTGLGHGDAAHVGDLDPYSWGLEQFACLEGAQGHNYRNATTSEIYFRFHSDGDDGRAMAGNLSNDIPGGIGLSAMSDLVGLSARKVIGTHGWSDVSVNFRVYWDGDLLEETLDGTGTEGNLQVRKLGKGAIWTSRSTQLCNWTKNTPSAQGDILGDWREEFILRSQDNQNLRIYTTTDVTPWRNYTLWHDHQYRNAMVWQMCGYNQPPHTSYFLGELEDITIAPPPLTMTGRVEIEDGGSITSSQNDEHVMVCNVSDTHVTIEDGASPYIATFNVPSWVQGNNNNEKIVYDYYTCEVAGGSFAGATRLVKQGEGILRLPKVDMNYTGPTEVWGGTISLDGSLRNSALWLNRFAKLESCGGSFANVRADYGSEIMPGGKDVCGSVMIDTLKLGFGARLKLDLFGDGIKADTLKVKNLTVEKKVWKNGPRYSAPVIEIVAHPVDGQITLAGGKYFVGEFEKLEGDMSNVTVEGLKYQKTNLVVEGGKIFIEVVDLRPATAITWSGAESTVWDFGATKNFVNEKGEADIFVNGDAVKFDDSATRMTVSLSDGLPVGSVEVNTDNGYVFTGDGAIIGPATLVKKGEGTLTIESEQQYTGGTQILGGAVRVASLANKIKEYGSLGALSTDSSMFVMANGAELIANGEITNGSPIQVTSAEGAVINNAATFLQEAPISGTTLTKRGGGTMKLGVENGNLSTMVIEEGMVVSVLDENTNPADSLVLKGGTWSDYFGSNSYNTYNYNVCVPEGADATWILDGRGEYRNRLTGAGVLRLDIKTTIQRTQLEGDWSAFAGTIIPIVTGSTVLPFDNEYGMPLATLDLTNGATAANSGKTFTIAKVLGSGSLAAPVSYSSSPATGVNTWRVGCNEDFAYEGVVKGASAFEKIGEGTMTVSGSWVNSKGTTISEGTLRLKRGAELGRTSVDVATGATLMFETNACANASGVSGAKLTRATSITVAGTLAVELVEGYTPAAGDSIVLWKEGVECDLSEATLQLPQLVAGLVWDSSELQSRGILRVADPQGITATEGEDSETSADVWQTDGVRVNVPLRNGASRNGKVLDKRVYIVKPTQK